VELFAEIRREYQFGIGTMKGVARTLGVHRRVVRQALADAVPWNVSSGSVSQAPSARALVI